MNRRNSVDRSPFLYTSYSWFSWAALKPETRFYSADLASAGPEAADTTGWLASVEL